MGAEKSGTSKEALGRQGALSLGSAGASERQIHFSNWFFVGCRRCES